MAPKAKQQPKSEAKAQPKAKADGQPKAKAKAQAEPKAEPKAPAPKAEPKAEPKAKADPKAKAKAEAKAKAKGEAAQVPAAAKSAPVAEPKGKAKAAAKGKSQPAAAPAPVAKAAEEPAPKSKSKKGKAKAEPAPPPPPPEPEPVEEEPAKKKKTNHRGGRNKNKEVLEFAEEVEIAQAVIIKEKKGKTAADVANAGAEKDETLHALRQRFSDAKDAGEARPATRKAELEALLKDIDQAMATKKVTARSKQAEKTSSTDLLQSLDDLARMDVDDREGMVEAIKAELTEARALELWKALRGKFDELKAQIEGALKASAPQAKETGGKGKAEESTKGASKGSAAREKESEDNREAAILRRLCALSKKDSKDVTASMVKTKELELDLGITKYLFTPPYRFNDRFEKQFNVLVEAARAPKGGGKGAKGAPPPKDLTITGLSADEVNECEKALKALDFSGTATRDLDNGLVMPSNASKAVIEKEFNVFVFKNQSQLNVFGTSKNVAAALAKIEDEGFSKSTTVAAELVKMIYSMDLLGKWRASSPGAQISINQPPAIEGKGSQPAKITVHGKSKEETEALHAKVEDFATNTASEVLKADVAVVGKLFERANGSWLAKRFREIQDASQNVSMKKASDGLLILGPKKLLAKVKADVKELLEKASFEPTKVTLDADKLRIFGKDQTDKIRESCGLMEMYKSKETTDAGRVDMLVLLGDEKSVTKAKAAIDEVIKNEGSSESVDVSDGVCKELLLNKGSKVQEFQNMHSTWISVDRKTLQVKITGSAKGVEATKKSITAFQKKADSLITKNITVEEENIGRIIGSRGATLKSITSECGVQINIDKNNPCVEIKGDEKGIAKAEEMINAVLGKGPDGEYLEKAEPAAEETAAARPKREAAKPKAKAKEYKGDMTADFPTLGGEAKAKPAAKAWGKSSKADAEEGPGEPGPTPAEAEANGEE